MTLRGIWMKYIGVLRPCRIEHMLGTGGVLFGGKWRVNQMLIRGGFDVAETEGGPVDNCAEVKNRMRYRVSSHLALPWSSLRAYAFGVGLMVVSAAGCGGSSTTGNGDEDRIVEGVNLTELFSAPTETEIELVLDDWSTRTHAAEGVVVVSHSPVSLGGTAATVRIVSHLVDGGVHYGAIISPDNATAGSLPLVVYLHGGDDGVDVSELLTVLPIALSSSQDDFVYLVPSFRSESLRYSGVTHTSTGSPSPWDRDVDDVLSLIDAATATVPAINDERIGVVGFSRGACVGMLTAIRDERIDLVIEFFGPTDFFSAWTEDIFADALEGSLRDLPGLSTLNTTVIQPLKSGELSYAEVREEMLRRSPVYFVNLLPPTQGHHGTSDNVVPVSEANLLKAAMTAEGLPTADFTVYVYTGGGHNPLTLLGSFERARGFLGRLSSPSSEIATRPGLND